MVARIISVNPAMHPIATPAMSPALSLWEECELLEDADEDVAEDVAEDTDEDELFEVNKGPPVSLLFRVKATVFV